MLTPNKKSERIMSPHCKLISKIDPEINEKELPNTVTPSVVTYLTPIQIQTAYGLNSIVTPSGSLRGSGVTIAVIIAYHYASLQADFNTFNVKYNLPSSILRIKSFGNMPNSDWAMEECLDTQMIHTAAPGANIMVVEAASPSFTDLSTAIQYAVSNGANIVSMSWGGTEFVSEASFGSIFNNTGVCYVASSGDIADQLNYPSASQNVISVGGTTLTVNSQNIRSSETAWNGAGAGPSTIVLKPSYQSTLPGTYRITPDMSLVANPNTGVICYCSIQGGYFTVGGTSVSAPLMSGILGVSNQLRIKANKSFLTTVTNAVKNNLQIYLYKTIYVSKTLYSSDVFDVLVGTDGVYKCGVGYDCCGLGAPIGNNLCLSLVNA